MRWLCRLGESVWMRPRLRVRLRSVRWTGLGRTNAVSAVLSASEGCWDRPKRYQHIPAGSTNTQNPNPHRLGFFLPVPPVLARFSGLASRAPPLRSRRFCPHRRLSVLRFLWWPRERSRGHFLCWRGFRGGRLWLATPVAVATECQAATKKPPAGGVNGGAKGSHLAAQ